MSYSACRIGPSISYAFAAGVRSSRWSFSLGAWVCAATGMQRPYEWLPNRDQVSYSAHRIGPSLSCWLCSARMRLPWFICSNGAGVLAGSWCAAPIQGFCVLWIPRASPLFGVQGPLGCCVCSGDFSRFSPLFGGSTLTPESSALPRQPRRPAGAVGGAAADGHVRAQRELRRGAGPAGVASTHTNTKIAKIAKNYDEALDLGCGPHPHKHKKCTIWGVQPTAQP
jgi:hypothetical protein